MKVTGRTSRLEIYHSANKVARNTSSPRIVQSAGRDHKSSRGGCAKSVISRQAQRRRESSGELRADRVGTDDEEVVDRGGQHHELPTEGKDQDGHRHVMRTHEEATTGEVRGLKYYQSMCTDVVIGKTTAYCRTTSDSRVHEGGL